ncbi:MAG TPA: MFS transporter [Streptosporangiaceae bacterium]|nr:MFS transporter [Streptosporangiaceae bacterium]
MAVRRKLGRQFGWLWAAYAVSAYGTGLGFGAFAVIAIRVLHAGPAQVSALAAAGLAVGAVLAVPLGPWVEFRRKRLVMIAMDLIRFAAMASIPAAYLLGGLSFAQLLVVSVIAGAAKIAFRSASGACLKALVRPEDLIVASARFESTTWTATVVGPPLGGLAIGLLGPVITVAADAASYLLSAAGIAAIRGREQRPQRAPARQSGPREAAGSRLRAAGLLDGWRYILRHPVLRRLFFNTLLVNGLLLATEPLVSVLMLGRLGFAPWQFGLAFAAPCVGGLIGARLAPRLAERAGQHTVMTVAGTLRACWPLGLMFIQHGAAGIVLVIVVQFGLVTSIGVFNPVYASYRLAQLGQDQVARTLAAWSVTSNGVTAALTALGGLLAEVTGPRVATGVAGVALLATPLLLPRRAAVPLPSSSPVTLDA